MSNMSMEMSSCAFKKNVAPSPRDKIDSPKLNIDDYIDLIIDDYIDDYIDDCYNTL